MYLSTSTVLDRNPGKHILGGLVIKIRLCYIESNFNNGLNFLRNILKIIKIAVITPVNNYYFKLDILKENKIVSRFIRKPCHFLNLLLVIFPVDGSTSISNKFKILYIFMYTILYFLCMITIK